MSQSNDPAALSRQSFAALRHPGARMYLIGAMLAMTGDSIEHVISYWIIYEKFRSPALAGFAIIAHWLPFLLFSVYAGALADRFDPRRVIQLGMALFMLVSLGWGILFWMDALAEWHAAVLLVVHGLAGVLWSPAAQLLIHNMVGPAQLHSAIRLIATSRTLGFLIGPAIGGGLMLLIGPVWAIVLNVVAYLPLALWLQRTPYGPKFQDIPQRVRTGVRGLNDIIATMRDITGNRTIVAMIALAGLTAFIVGNAYHAQLPEFTHDFGHGDSSLHYSLLAAATAVGALLAGLMLEGSGRDMARPQTVIVLVILWCIALVGFALTTDYRIGVALLVVAGFLDLWFNSAATTLVQLEAPAAIRGRVVGLYNMFSLGLRAFSGVTIGIGGALIGIHWSLAASSAALIAAMIAMLSFTMRTRATVPARED